MSTTEGPTHNVVDSPERAAGSTAIWALLVGVEKYQVLCPEASGAGKDVENLYNYLVSNRRVPSRNVRVLRDEEATRRGIIDYIDNHFIYNEEIRPNDAMIFYFSGHGVACDAPASWPSTGTSGEAEPAKIECIVPYDSVVDDPSTSDPATSKVPPGIPDRTLHAKFRNLADVKGDNITIIFDCCHSEHAMRGKNEDTKDDWFPRGLPSRKVGQLRDDTDKHIWDACPGVGTRGSNPDASHVLLAACSRDEEAQGNHNGGLFTNCLIVALQRAEGTLSNRELIDHIKEILRNSYNHLEERGVKLPHQSPHCVGMHADRPLFQRTHIQRDRFAVKPGKDKSTCEISVGETAGVTVGTIFKLVSKSYQDASAVVTELNPWSCIAMLPDGFDVSSGDVKATVGHLAEAISIHVTNKDAGNECSDQTYGTLLDRLRTTQADNAHRVVGFKYSEHLEDADLVLEVDKDGVEFKRRDTEMKSMVTTNPRLRREHIDSRFTDVLRHISLFNFYLYLGQNSQSRPFMSQVEVDFCRLKHPKARPYPAFLVDDDLMEPDESAEFNFNEKGEVDVTHEQGALYALVLKNNSERDLFPYVLFFDPATYQVLTFYKPLTREAPLQKNGSIQLGRSTECMAAIFFTLENQERETGFLKIILSTEEIPVDHMELGSALGYDGNDEPNFFSVRNASAEEPNPPLPGAWDTMLRRVNVLPK